MTEQIQYLKARWDQTLALSGLKDERESPHSSTLFEKILRDYSEPIRKYHTLQHLEQAFHTLDEWFSDVPDRPAVEMALWYHDYIYRPMSDINESTSAYIAMNHVLYMGGSRAMAEKVQHLILLTEHKAKLPETRDEQILIDVDFSILASNQEAFDEYERQIRDEYSMFADELYRPGRAAILAQFLARPSLYFTEEGLRHEAAARANLERSLKKLGFTQETATALLKNFPPKPDSE